MELSNRSATAKFFFRIPSYLHCFHWEMSLYYWPSLSCMIFNQLPPNVRLVTLTRKVPASKKNKGKQICDIELGGSDKPKDGQAENCLATLDIFAGCGGLSEGLQRSGMLCSCRCCFIGTFWLQLPSDHWIVQDYHLLNGLLNMKNLLGMHLVKTIQKLQYLSKTAMWFWSTPFLFTLFDMLIMYM